MAFEKNELNYKIECRCQGIDGDKAKMINLARFLSIMHTERTYVYLSSGANRWPQYGGNMNFLDFIKIPNHELIMRRPRFIIQTLLAASSGWKESSDLN